MYDKQSARARRAKKTRALIKKSSNLRLSVHKSNKHFYAQILDKAGHIILSASTNDKAVRSNLACGGNVSAAQKIGHMIGEKALSAGIKNVAFDRSGFRYHGRIKAFADAAREKGIVF